MYQIVCLIHLFPSFNSKFFNRGDYGNIGVKKLVKELEMDFSHHAERVLESSISPKKLGSPPNSSTTKKSI